jgi:hypothetical protein
VTAVVIFRRTDLPEIGPASHLPAEGETGPLLGNAPTVLRTLCGSVGIGRWFDREDATCALCVALAGRRPGKKGKAYLRRLTEEASRGR